MTGTKQKWLNVWQIGRNDFWMILILIAAFRLLLGGIVSIRTPQHRGNSTQWSFVSLLSTLVITSFIPKKMHVWGIVWNKDKTPCKPALQNFPAQILLLYSNGLSYSEQRPGNLQARFCSSQLPTFFYFARLVQSN